MSIGNWSMKHDCWAFILSPKQNKDGYNSQIETYHPLMTYTTLSTDCAKEHDKNSWTRYICFRLSQKCVIYINCLIKKKCMSEVQHKLRLLSQIENHYSIGKDSLLFSVLNDNNLISKIQKHSLLQNRQYKYTSKYIR